METATATATIGRIKTMSANILCSCGCKTKNYKKKLMGLKFKIFTKAEHSTMSSSAALLRKATAAASATAASAASTSARPATATISGGSAAPSATPKPADAPKATKKASAPATDHSVSKPAESCRWGDDCTGCYVCRKKKAPAKASGGGSAEIADLRKEVAVLTDLVKAGFEKQSVDTSKLSDTVVTGFAERQAAEERLQRSFEMMMGGIGKLATTLEGGITSRRSVPELPAPSESLKRRPLPALPAPAPEELDSEDSDSKSALENFKAVTKKLRDCPLNLAVISLIPLFVLKYSALDSDALACLLLAILSGKKVSDFKKMGEFTRSRVMPLLTKANIPIFQKFFAELAPKCKPDSCVRVENAEGTKVSNTFHILGKEVDAIRHLIRILREEE
jgi:hypothetical protein